MYALYGTYILIPYFAAAVAIYVTVRHVVLCAIYAWVLQLPAPDPGQINWGLVGSHPRYGVYLYYVWMVSIWGRGGCPLGLARRAVYTYISLSVLTKGTGNQKNLKKKKFKTQPTIVDVITIITTVGF